MLNVVWIFLWHFELLVLSMMVVFLLPATLIAIYLRLEIGRTRVPLREKMAYHVPFSVYLGWVAIASMANVAVTLRSIGWDGFGLSPEAWALVAIVLALVVASLVLISRRDAAFGLVIIWALLGMR